MKSSRNLKFLLICGCLLGSVILGWTISLIKPENKQKPMVTPDAIAETEKEVQSVTDTYTLEDLKQQVSDVSEEIPVAFKELWKTNKDIYAWISIADTDIDYPVLHHLNGSPDYYLDHDWKGDESKDGAIFSQWDYNQDFAEDYATFLYGHNWNNNRMFSSLHAYKEAEYRNIHKEICICTPMEVYNYEIVAVFNFSSISFPYYYNVTDSAAVMKMYKDMQDSCIGNCWFDRKYQIKEKDHLLFLSTCNGKSGQRFLIGAVRKENDTIKNE